MRKANNPLAAQILGLKALAFLVASPGDFRRFLGQSGLDTTSIRARAAEPEFLAAVLDFLLGCESLLAAFCENELVDARAVHTASSELAGPSEE